MKSTNEPLKMADQPRVGNMGRVAIMGLSITIQQLIFFTEQNEHVMALHVSEWVEWTPIWMLWMLYFLVPIAYVTPKTCRSLLKSYAVAGWLFVFAAMGWTLAFDLLSEKYGIPVSADKVEKYHQK